MRDSGACVKCVLLCVASHLGAMPSPRRPRPNLAFAHACPAARRRRAALTASIGESYIVGTGCRTRWRSSTRAISARLPCFPCRQNALRFGLGFSVFISFPCVPVLCLAVALGIVTLRCRRLGQLLADGQCHCHSIRRSTQRHDATPLLNSVPLGCTLPLLLTSRLFMASPLLCVDSRGPTVPRHCRATPALLCHCRTLLCHAVTIRCLVAPCHCLARRVQAVPLLCGARRRCAMPSPISAMQRFAVDWLRCASLRLRLTVQGFTSPSLRPAKSPP